MPLRSRHSIRSQLMWLTLVVIGKTIGEKVNEGFGEKSKPDPINK